jgi:RNA polymerase sigma-70 factor, ECF subfamily
MVDTSQRGFWPVPRSSTQEVRVNHCMPPQAHLQHGAAGRGFITDWSPVLDNFAQGDAQALDQVTRLIIGLLSRMRASDLRDLWDDIAQDVLLALLSSVRRGAIRDPQAFVGYCAAITRNALARRLAQLGHARARSSELAIDDIADVPRRDQDLDLRLDVVAGLQGLPTTARAVLSAIYLEGHSYQEAAQKLGLPLGSLKRIQTRGLRLLRDQLPAAGERGQARAMHRSDSSVPRLSSHDRSVTHHDQVIEPKDHIMLEIETRSQREHLNHASLTEMSPDEVDAVNGGISVSDLIERAARLVRSFLQREEGKDRGRFAR